jgi:indole-3-glycerol phosphate synthase
VECVGYDPALMPGSRRFSQAISEGDGISVIVPVGDAEDARAAEDQGAEAVVLGRAVAGVPEATGLPVLWRSLGSLEEAAAVGADACVIVVGRHADAGNRLERLCAQADELGLDCVLDVRDEEELELALARVDPEIFLLSGRQVDEDEDPLDHVLGLLPDVPAGKLAIADLDVHGRDDVVALERAGVDAVLVGPGPVAHLVGGPPPEV